MVGGKVIGLARGAETTLVHVQDRYPPYIPDTCSVRVIERRRRDGSPVRIEVGDSLWWQGGDCLWTPAANRERPEGELRCGTDFDIRIPKVGYSH